MNRLGAMDCLSEGIRPRGMDPVDIATNLVDDFSEAWDAIYADRGYGWHANPWVWEIEFEPLHDAPGETVLDRQTWERLYRGTFEKG